MVFGFSRKSWLRLAGDGAWAAFGQIASIVGGVLGIRILTELASPAVFGESALWLGALALARNFFVVPLSMFQVRYYSIYRQDEKLVAFQHHLCRLLDRGMCWILGIGLCIYLGRVAWTGDSLRPGLLAVLLLMNVVDGRRTIFQNQ